MPVRAKPVPKTGSSWRIQINNLQTKLTIDKKWLRGLVRAALAQEKLPRARVGIAIVDDMEIAQLNARYLGRRAPTDVLAFPFAESFTTAAGEELGEIVISAEKAARVAKGRRVPPKDELALYVVHGLLHLTGHRDRTPTEARRMHKREREVLQSIRRGRRR